MKYISTRGNHDAVDSAFAIQRGMVPSGGLFVPESLNRFSINYDISSYSELAASILGHFLTDFDAAEVQEYASHAYTQDKFESSLVAPLAGIRENTHVLELWHGPTAAFKDMALQILPYLLTGSARKQGAAREIVILVATSGDTGKAALEGFKDIPGTRVIVFYPKHGVSHIQEKQMLTTGGKNTHVVGVKGNFDDCQTMVKNIFSDHQFSDELLASGKELSSANSINWGRLVPQIVYYFHSYISLVNTGVVRAGELVNFSVPTGNFGNILAGYYAKMMGLPVGKLVCASNRNKVLYDFFVSGSYDLGRDFFRTSSPSMDILVSSNLERFLFEMMGRDPLLVDNCYRQLSSAGKFSVDPGIRLRMQEHIVPGYADEGEVRNEIRTVFSEKRYLIDTHTAVASHVTRSLQESGQLDGHTVVLATASAFKFSQSVYDALTGEGRADDEYVLLEALQQMTGVSIHRSLRGLENLAEKRETVIDTSEGRRVIRDILELN